LSRRRTLALAVLVSALATAPFVLADEGARVVIVAPSPQDPTALRMRDELSVLGFDVVLVKAGPATANLSDVARAKGAAAAARVESWPPEILVWVGSDGKEAGEDLRVSESLTGSIESELLALRAVELLRGRLLPVPAASPPSAPTRSPAPTPSVTAAPSAAPPITPPTPSASPSATSTPPPTKPPPSRASTQDNRVSMLAGPALLVSPGGLSISPSVALSGRLPIWNRLSAEAWTFLPLAAGSVQNAEGEIALRAFFLGAGLSFRLTSPDEPFFVSLGAGVGPMLLWYEGEAEAPRIAASGVRPVALAYGRAGIGYRVHPRVRLRLDGLAGPVFPEPVLRIVAREVASFGRPAVFLALGVEVMP
jgi:hypothetical protein